jgi:hypothetical protein
LTRLRIIDISRAVANINVCITTVWRRALATIFRGRVGRGIEISIFSSIGVRRIRKHKVSLGRGALQIVATSIFVLAIVPVPIEVSCVFEVPAQCCGGGMGNEKGRMLRGVKRRHQQPVTKIQR